MVIDTKKQTYSVDGTKDEWNSKNIFLNSVKEIVKKSEDCFQVVFPKIYQKLNKIINKSGYDFEKIKVAINDNFNYFVLFDFDKKKISFCPVAKEPGKQFYSGSYYQILKPDEFGDLIFKSIYLKESVFFKKRKNLDKEMFFNEINRKFYEIAGDILSKIVTEDNFFDQEENKKRISLDLFWRDEFLDFLGEEKSISLIKELQRYEFGEGEFEQYLTLNKYSSNITNSITNKKEPLPFVTYKYSRSIVILNILLRKYQSIDIATSADLLSKNIFAWVVDKEDIENLCISKKCKPTIVSDYLNKIVEKFNCEINLLGKDLSAKNKGRVVQRIRNLIRDYDDIISCFERKFGFPQNNINISDLIIKNLFCCGFLSGYEVLDTLKIFKKHSINIFGILESDFENRDKVLKIQSYSLGYSGKHYYCYPGDIEKNELEELSGAIKNTYLELKEYKEENSIINFIDFEITPEKNYEKGNKLFFSKEKFEKMLDGLDCFVKKEFGFKNFVSNEVFVDKENDKITLLFPRSISFVFKNTVVK